MHLCFIFDGKCLKVLTYQVDVSTMVTTIAINLAENNIRVNASFEFCLFVFQKQYANQCHFDKRT